MSLRNWKVAGTIGLLLLPAKPAVEAQQIDTSAALAALREAAHACENDRGATWGKSLCGPIALVERQSRLVIANDSTFRQPFVQLGDAFITNAPTGVGFANTMFDWAGRPWAMILLPLPTDAFDRVTLVMHEVFHREQKSLGLAGQDPPNNHLDELDGRRWLRLELQAYAKALDAIAVNDQRSRAHTEAALLFRARRHQLYPAADSLEATLEMQEGLAEYTGERLAMAYTGESAARVARHLREYQSTPSYVRSFAYATGPAIGVLLDHFAPGWQRSITQTRDPARVLARAIALALPADLAREVERRAPQYDAVRITAEETTRDSSRRVAMTVYRSALVDGPTLTLTQKWLGRNFDPDALVGFDAQNTVYPTGIFNSEWGALAVTSGGALLSNDQLTLRVSAPRTSPSDGRNVTGDGWTLTLKPGWSVQPSPRRPGSYVVRSTAP
jgi:hypothetical protein